MYKSKAVSEELTEKVRDQSCVFRTTDVWFRPNVSKKFSENSIST